MIDLEPGSATTPRTAPVAAGASHVPSACGAVVPLRALAYGLTDNALEQQTPIENIIGAGGLLTNANAIVVATRPEAVLPAFVTRIGGHLGPVTFDRRGRKIMPLSVAPWAAERLDLATPPIIRALRGDFFCMPFGGNATPFRGRGSIERHPR